MRKRREALQRPSSREGKSKLLEDTKVKIVSG